MMTTTQDDAIAAARVVAVAKHQGHDAHTALAVYRQLTGRQLEVARQRLAAYVERHGLVIEPVD